MAISFTLRPRLSQCPRHLSGPCHLRQLSGLCRLRHPSEATPLSRQSECNGPIRTRSKKKLLKNNLPVRSGLKVTCVRIGRSRRCPGAPGRAYDGFLYTRFGVQSAPRQYAAGLNHKDSKCLQVVAICPVIMFSSCSVVKPICDSTYAYKIIGVCSGPLFGPQ